MAERVNNPRTAKARVQEAPEEKSPVRVLVVDDHAVVRRGVMDILREGFPHATFNEAENVQQALEFVRRNPCDILILDITMPGKTGLEGLTELRHARAKMQVLVLSMHHEDQYAVRALKAGAAGYVTKNKAPEQLVLAVSRVLAGGKYVSPELGEALAAVVLSPDHQKPHEALSEREFQVLCRMAQAKTLKEIADELHLSIKTVSTYHVRLLEKMNMTRDAELVRYALENGLVD
jgi:two-component system, NarL family, invasion response regulator UvrY